MSDKVLHFIAYSIFGFMLYKALTEESWVKRKWFSAFFVATAYGMTDEFHQYFVPMRETDLLDLFADAAGGGAGAFIASFAGRGGRIE